MCFLLFETHLMVSVKEYRCNEANN